MSALHHYASELRSDLPAAVYRPTHSRLIWLPVHLSMVGASMATILGGGVSLGYALLLSLIIGHSFACLAFLAHEILHGTIVRSRRLQDLFGGLCFFPHCLPPDVWRTWHNRFHHGYTGVRGQDPDGFVDPVLYRRSRLLQMVFTFLPGSGYLRSATYFLFYFSFQVLFVLFVHSRKYNYWTAQKWNKQVALFAMGMVFWATVAVAVGPSNFLLIYVLPLMVANSIQMIYVTTNHWLCEGTHDENDPLRNSLSIRLPRIIDWLHLNTSYHTEHHLGPTINPRHAPLIYQSMAARYGKRCRRLSLAQILLMTYRTPRLHLSEKELVDLRSGDVYSTLGPQGEPPELVDRVPVPVRRRRPSDSQPAVSDPTETEGQAIILPFPQADPQPAAPPRRMAA